LHESVVHTLPSSQLIGVPPHTPSEHTSLDVQAFPSLHITLLLVFVQPWAGSQASVVQTLQSLQLGAGPPTQAPPEHVSLVVQAFPSLHGLLLSGCRQPSETSQVSSVQPLLSSQFGAGPPTHIPPEQASFIVQALPSLHRLVLFTFLQPVAGMQESSVQTFASSQSGGGPPTQDPPEHVSLVVQAFPSLHELLLFTF
jgi:hypothetical protein